MDIKSSDSAEIKADEEDKKFVSQSVAFVIGHTRNGFVSLCASIATLLKEQSRLKTENESLKQQIFELKSEMKIVPLEDEDEIELNLRLKNNLESLENAEDETDNIIDPTLISKHKRKEYMNKKYVPLKGCLCDSCYKNSKDSVVLTPPLRKGNKVMFSGELNGTVLYIGHVDKLYFPEIFAGLKLDEAIGDTNGTVGNKSYFKVPFGYGLFVPLYNICFVIK